MSRRLDFGIVDAHQHFVFPGRFGYYWMQSVPPDLRRSFTPPMLLREMESAGVQSTIVVQADPSVEETYALIEAARQHRFICGIVGSIDLADPEIERQLDAYRSHPLVRAVRHQQAEDAEAEWFLRPEVMRGLAAVEESGLGCDLLCRAHQLHTIATVADTFPRLKIMLEHAGKPAIAHDGYVAWVVSISELRGRENVSCKLSELLAQASWKDWKPEQLRPYLHHCVGVFGYERLVWGSGWPVCLVASTYKQTLETTLENLPDPAPEEIELVFRENALKWYAPR